jgi:hypothetical protein
LSEILRDNVSLENTCTHEKLFSKLLGYYLIDPFYGCLKEEGKNLARKRLMLILGPSFRRDKRNEPLPALERYDGLFFRVARKHMGHVKYLDVVVMVDDLTLVDGGTTLPHNDPKGDQWGKQSFSNALLEKAKEMNEDFLTMKLKNEKFSEVFISMGKKYAKALPDLTQYRVKVIFPASGGPGPKAKALKEWLAES